jgi:type IV secretory pathway VirB9-like protein
MSDRLEIRINTKKQLADSSAEEVPSQHARAETMRFQLKVDRQIKSSYLSFEIAEQAGVAIKQGHPVVQVAVYDAVEGTITPIDIAKA